MLPRRVSKIFRYLSTHRLLAAGLGVALVAVSVFVIAFFQPHKLFIDSVVDETVPPTSSESSSPAPSSEAPAPASKVLSATFRSLEHETVGKAVITESLDGSRVLSLVDFETSNGPDLRVYLSAGSSDRSFGKEYGEDFVELGKLKGNIGDQNYDVPRGTDLAKYRNAVIWCKRFSVGFGVATL